MNSQTVYRLPHDANNLYVVMSKFIFEDPDISWKAKGLMGYLLSRPNDWIVRHGDLVKRSPDGAFAVRNAVQELEQSGYLTRTRARDEHGRYNGVEILIHEQPVSLEQRTGRPHQADDPSVEAPHVVTPHADKPHADNPHTDKPHVGNPHVVNHTVLSTDLVLSTDQILNTDSTHGGESETETLFSDLSALLSLNEKESARLLKEHGREKLTIAAAITLNRSPLPDCLPAYCKGVLKQGNLTTMALSKALEIIEAHRAGGAVLRQHRGAVESEKAGTPRMAAAVGLGGPVT